MPLTLLRHGTPKPPIGPLKLDIGNSLSRQFNHAWVLNDFNSTTVFDYAAESAVATSPFLAGVYAWASGLHGSPVVNSVSSSGHLFTLGTDTALSLPTGASTLMFGYRKTDATLRISGAFGGSTTAANLYGAHVPYSDGTVYFDYGGNSSGTTRVSVGSLTFGNDIWAFTIGSRGMEIWQNSKLVASNAANPTRTNGAQNWGLFNHSSSGSDAADASFLYVWSRQLAISEIQQITAEPFCMFQTRPLQRWFVLPSSGLPPGLGPAEQMEMYTMAGQVSMMR